MFSRNCILVHTIVAIMAWSLVKGFGINIMIVPEDDPSQVICTLALLSKYFRSGESLSGSVLSISLTSASINVQQNLLRAIHTDRAHPWTVVLIYARTENPTPSASMALHEKPQCYFVILKNLENDDFDDIFENWKLTVNWNPMAQFVVYLASVEETDEEMTELMIEILLSYLNKKIYNINIIGQNEENGFFYGKTVFPYHPDNNCGNRVIAIETLDICDYQEAEEEHSDEEKEYVYDVREDGNGDGGRNVIKEQGEEELDEGEVQNHGEEEIGEEHEIGEDKEVGEEVIEVEEEKEVEIGKGEVEQDDVGNEEFGEDIDEENIGEKEGEENVIEQGVEEEEIGEAEVGMGVVAVTERGEMIIGEVDVGEENTEGTEVEKDVMEVGEEEVGRDFVGVTKEGETITKKDEMSEEYIREEGMEEKHTELEKGWKKVAEKTVREGVTGMTIIGKDEVEKDSTEHAVETKELEKDVVGSPEERGMIKGGKDAGEENVAEKKREVNVTKLTGAEEEIVEGVDGEAEEKVTIKVEEELDAEKEGEKEEEELVGREEEGKEVRREHELRNQKGTKEILMKDEVADENEDYVKTGYENIGYGVEEKVNIANDKLLGEEKKGEEEVGQEYKEEGKKINKKRYKKQSGESKKTDNNLGNNTLVNVNSKHQVIPERKVEVNRKIEEKKVFEKKNIEKKRNREIVDESFTMKRQVRREVKKKKTMENDKTEGLNKESDIKEEFTETSNWNNNYNAVENGQVEKNLSKTSTENCTKNSKEEHQLCKNSVGKNNENNNHRRMEKLHSKPIKPKGYKNFHKFSITKLYSLNARKSVRRTRRADMDFDDDDMDSEHSLKDDEAASQGTIYMEEHFRALFLDKFPRDLSGCTLVAAFRSWEPYIFSLEKAKETKNEYPDSGTMSEGITNGVEMNNEFENGTGGDIFGEAGDVAGGVDVFGDTAIFENSDGDENGEGGGDGPGNSDDFEPDTSQIEGDLKLTGIEYKIVQTISERLHINIDIQVENSNLYQLFQQLMDGDIEMVVGGIDEDPSISQFVSSTIPYHQDDLTWCVAKAKHQLNLFNFLATFRVETWLLTQACVLLLSLTVFFTQRALKIQLAQLQGYSSIFLRLFGLIITTQSMQLKSMPTALKIALGSAFFMSLMFSNIYNSFLISTLTTPKSMYQISHITEIYNHRMDIMGSVDNVRHMNKDGEIFKYLREKFQMCYNIEECLSRAAIDDSVAVAVSRMHTFYNPRIPRDLLYCFDRDENIYAYLVTMLLPKKFHLLHMINSVIQHIIESGHIQKWSRELDIKRQIEQETHQVRETIVGSLNLAEFGGCFAFTGFLLLFALVVFMLECCVHRMVTQQRTRLILVKILHRQFS